MECSVCFERFDQEVRRPKVLPCGHTFCLHCLQTPSFGSACPQDRRAFRRDQLINIPDNFALLADMSNRAEEVWCEACHRRFNGDCADAGHRPSSMRMQQQASALQDALRELQELRTTVQVQEGRLRTVEKQQQPTAAVPLPRLELDLSDLSFKAGGELRKERNELLLGDRLDRARKVTGLNCSPHADWSEAVLRRIGPHVEELYVRQADYQHLRAIQGMAALRTLNLTCLLRDDDCNHSDVPTLPLQLEDLRVRNFRFEHLLSVEWMPKLRKLELVDGDGSVEVPDFDFTPAPSHCGLKQLEVHVKSLSTVVSLVRANAATLQELQVRCSSRSTGEWSCPDLPGKLQRSSLVALHRLVLSRRDPPSRDDHGPTSCGEQLADLRARLGADVVVECSECSD